MADRSQNYKRIHLIAPFHTVSSAAFSHCAFTGKALRFSAMMVPLGYEVFEYGNEGSESKATEHITILSKTDYARLFKPLGPKEFHGGGAVIGSPGWTAFHGKLMVELAMRVQPGDIIAHPFGRSHSDVVKLFPQANHIETGIGYPDTPFGAWRIFESETWRHYHWGRDDSKPEFHGNQGLNRFYSFVIPNSYDPTDWPLGDGSGGYLLFMGRIDPCKGILTIGDIIKAWDKLHPDDGLKFVFAGQGDMEPVYKMLGPELSAKRIDYRGAVLGKDRAELCGKVRAMLMPTAFVEPFGGAGVESMMTGTPLIASDWGAFTETIQTGINGFRCKTLKHWIRAIELTGDMCPVGLPGPLTGHTGPCGKMHRALISNAAQYKFSLENCGRMYDQAFQQIAEINGSGWYTLPTVTS